MTSINELFQNAPAASKRKLEDPTSSFSHKSAKFNTKSSPQGVNGHSKPQSVNGKQGGKAAFVQDEILDEDEEDVEAGPALPPGGLEADDEQDEDEEGRFFGGGVSKQERKIMDFIDENETSEVEEKIDSAWLRRTAINFERKINKNAELRAKYEADPMKFVSSEADLDAEIKGLSLLSEHGELYDEFVKTGSVGSLVGLLAHENTDIAISVCELLAELTDEDSSADDERWKILVDALIESDLLELLVSNLKRVDEDSNETDRAGVYHVLNVLENLLSEPQNLELVGANDGMMAWLIARMKKSDPNERNKVGQNRQYSAEILAILLQGSQQNRDRFAKQDGVDVLLQILSTYRKKDPEKDSGEEEFVENLFDCLTCLVEVKSAADQFLESEGIELCLIMLREGKLSKSRALKVLNHAMSSSSSIGSAPSVCQRLVDAAGLKTIFGMLMKSKSPDRQTVEHLLGILSSMLRFLPADSEGRIRTLAKFMEKDYEKIHRLVDLRKEHKARLDRVDAEIQKARLALRGQEPTDLEVDDWDSRRLEGGLFPLQSLDVILSWLVAEDDGAKKEITSLLSGLGILKTSLQEQLHSMDPDPQDDDPSSSSSSQKLTRDILETLISCL